MNDAQAFDNTYTQTATVDEALPHPQDEGLHGSRFPKSDLWEETAWIVTAECGDFDIFLWAAAYRLCGHGDNVWLVDGEGAEQDTMFFAVPRNQRNEGLTDHDFARLSWEPGNRQTADALRVHSTASGGTRWNIGKRQYIAEANAFQLKGEHAGVELDLVFRPVPPALWEWGSFADAPARDRGGYDLFCRVDGTIEAGGKVYTIKNGTGIKERITVGASANPVKTLPAPREMYWTIMMAPDDTAVFLFQPGRKGLDLGHVVRGGEDLEFKSHTGEAQVCLTLLDRWYDPRSGLSLPCHWHLSMASAQGLVDLEIRAHGRCWFNWILRNGIRLNTYLLCTANGFFRASDGALTPFEDVLVAQNWLRTYSTLREIL